MANLYLPKKWLYESTDIYLEFQDTWDFVRRCKWFRHFPSILSSFPKLSRCVFSRHQNSTLEVQQKTPLMSRELQKNTHVSVGLLHSKRIHTDTHTSTRSFHTHQIHHTSVMKTRLMTHGPHVAVLRYKIQQNQCQADRCVPNQQNPVMADHIRFVICYGLWRYQ